MSEFNFDKYTNFDRNTKKLSKKQKESSEEGSIKSIADKRNNTEEEYQKLISDPKTLVKIQSFLYFKKEDIYLISFLIWLSYKCHLNKDYKIKYSSYDITKKTVFNGNYIFNEKEKLNITKYIDFISKKGNKTTFDIRKLLDQVIKFEELIELSYN